MNDRDMKHIAFALDKLVRQEVTEQLIQAQLEMIKVNLEDFEKNLREKVKVIVDGLSITDLQKHHDLMTMRDMLHVTYRLQENR